MHDGSLDTLADVVRYYAAGGSGDPARSEHVRPLALTGRDTADLVAFLESLTGEVRPGLAPTVWRARARETTLKFVDGRGRPVRDLAVTLRPEGDTLPGDMPRTSPVRRLVTDRAGRVTFRPPFRTHTRLVLEDGLPVDGGALVPDTAHTLRLVVPVRGVARLAVTWEGNLAAPPTLLARHVTELELPAANRPASVFRRVGEVEVGGVRVVRYEAPFRTDVSSEIDLDLPGEREGRALRVRLEEDGEVRLRVR
jgi:hypothetical protein